MSCETNRDDWGLVSPHPLAWHLLSQMPLLPLSLSSPLTGGPSDQGPQKLLSQFCHQPALVTEINLIYSFLKWDHLFCLTHLTRLSWGLSEDQDARIL